MSSQTFYQCKKAEGQTNETDQGRSFHFYRRKEKNHQVIKFGLRMAHTRERDCGLFARSAAHPAAGGGEGGKHVAD